MLTVCLFSLLTVCLSLSPPAEALPPKKCQPRQVQTSHAAALPQHALRGPAGSASAPPTGPAHGPVHVVPGSYVPARSSGSSSSTAASPPALTPHTHTHTVLSLVRRGGDEARSPNATTLSQNSKASIITSSGSRRLFLTLYQLHTTEGRSSRSSSGEVSRRGKERSRRRWPLACQTHNVASLNTLNGTDGLNHQSLLLGGAGHRRPIICSTLRLVLFIFMIFLFCFAWDFLGGWSLLLWRF